MRNTIVEMVEKKKEVSITCDECKTTYEDIIEMQEFLHISYTAGYGTVFEDMAHIEADICQHCIKAKFGDILRITPGFW